MDNIATINGRAAAAFAKEAAWHKLGVVLDHCMTWEEAITKANLDWEVAKEPLFNRFGKELPAWGIFRQDGANVFLGTVGAIYAPIQNQYQFDFVDAVLGAKNGAHYESAGALGNGERVWCLANLAEAFEVVPGDSHESYLLFTTSHDGSTAAQAGLTSVRVVCQNTLTQALSSNGKSFIKVKHTKDAERRLDLALKEMSGVVTDIHELRDRLRTLAQRKLTRETAKSIFDQLFPPDDNGKVSTRAENIMADILQKYESNDNNAFPQIRGTAYNMLNALTEYTDHARSARVTQDGYTMERARAESALFGSGDVFKREALEVVMAVAKTLPEIQHTRYFDAPIIDLPAETILDLQTVKDTPPAKPVLQRVYCQTQDILSEPLRITATQAEESGESWEFYFGGLYEGKAIEIVWFPEKPSRAAVTWGGETPSWIVTDTPAEALKKYWQDLAKAN